MLDAVTRFEPALVQLVRRSSVMSGPLVALFPRRGAGRGGGWSVAEKPAT